jgi:two-component system sensor histidine kinase HydH
MKRRLANVSPWILAAACTLLTFIIGAFAVNNYSREKMLMTDALLQKGVAVIRFLDTGVRVSMRANWQNRTDSGGSWTDHVQSVIDQLRDQEDIHFVELIDAGGVVLAASNPEMIGKKVGSETLLFIRKGFGDDPVYRMYRDDKLGEQGFQVAQIFKPRFRQGMQQFGSRGRGMMENMRRMQPGLERLQQELEKLQGQQFALLVELDLEQFSSAVRRQLWQIAILSVVLLLVGVGGWLSLLTLQGFKGTQSRLQRIRAFNDLLVESLPVGIIATDGAGNIQMVNAAAEDIAGVSTGRIINHQPDEVLPAQLALPLASRGKHMGKPHSSESTFETPEGRSRSLFMTVLSVADDEDNFTESFEYKPVVW